MFPDTGRLRAAVMRQLEREAPETESSGPFLSPPNFTLDGRDPPAETLLRMALSR
jgi:hypothetical protein